MLWFFIFLALVGFVLVLALGLALYAVLLEPYSPVLRHVQIPVPDSWPRLSVLHLSDLHVRDGATRLYAAQDRLLRAIPGRPDVVCVTGDTCERLDDVPLAAALLHEVRPRWETFVVLGNHEHHASVPHDLAATARQGKSPWLVIEHLAWRVLGDKSHSSGTDEGHAIAGALAESGLRVLNNRGVRLEVGPRSLWVAGVDSTWSGCAEPLASLRGRGEDEPCLALVHEPEGALPLVGRGADVVLAGHTHGGQVRFPFAGAPFTWRTDPRIQVAAGLQHLGHSILCISAGLGQTVPLRFGCPPEATWIECIPAHPEPRACPEPVATDAFAAASARGASHAPPRLHP